MSYVYFEEIYGSINPPTTFFSFDILVLKDIIIEVEFEERHHEFDHLLGVLGESLLQFAGIADQHLTGRGLLL